MIAKQFSLINFTQQKSIFQQFCRILYGHSVNIEITKTNIIHVEKEKCPNCGTIMDYNGFYESSALYYRSQYAYFKVGQQYCPDCDKTHIPQNRVVQTIVAKSNMFLENQMISLAEKGLSYPDISRHLKETLSVRVSAEHVSNIVKNHISSITLADPLIYPYDWYCYDEQHLKQNGKKVYRVVIYRPKTGDLVYEEDHDTFNKAVLRKILRKVFANTKPLGFTFDMAPSYPEVFTDVFGKDLNIQWCLFHLNKRIFKELKKHCRIGRELMWQLEDLQQFYEMLDIFYVRTSTIKYIIEAKKRLQQFKGFIKGKVDNETRAIKEFEKGLIKDIFHYQHKLKLMRKRNKETLRPRSKKEALERIHNLSKEQSLIAPFKKRIKYIKKNFDKFVTHLKFKDAEATNNKLEGKFGITLRKTEKVKFRSRTALKRCLKLKRLKARGVLFLKSVSMQTLALISTFGAFCKVPD